MSRSIGGLSSTTLALIVSDSKIGAIYEGTSNIQMETIFRHLKKQYGTQS